MTFLSCLRFHLKMLPTFSTESLDCVVRHSADISLGHFSFSIIAFFFCG